MTVADARAWALAQGLPPYRGQQLVEGLARGAERFADLTALPAALRERLDDEGPAAPGAEVRRQVAADGTVKALLELRDGSRVECVSIPTRDRHTVCVSSQVGCGVGCTFCASGLDGVRRDCTAGEIVYQVVHHHRRRPVTNVVFMGSGEPLMNYARVLQAIRVLGEPRGLGIGRRRITVSTSGVADRIPDLGRDEPQVTLALSLHAPDDETRSRLVPLNRRWPIARLMAAMDEYRALVNRRITIEYVLLADANMGDDHAERLAILARRHHAHVNLIPFNPVAETPHRRPDDAAVLRFAALVRHHGGKVTVRGQRGADIDAACGQLALNHDRARRRRPRTAPARSA